MRSFLFHQARNAYYILINSLLRLCGHSRGAARLLARTLGLLRYHAGYVGRGRGRRVYLEAIRQAFPELPKGRERKILAEFWGNHQASFVELFLSPRLSEADLPELVDFEGLDHLEKALAPGRGAVVTTLHLGDERLLHMLLALRGFPVRALSAEFSDYGWAARRARLQAAGAFHPVETGGSLRWMFRSLDHGEAVFMAISGFGGRRGAWVELLGREILFSTAPARLALGRGVPVITAVCLRRPQHRRPYLVRLDPAVTPSRVRRPADRELHRLTSRLVEQLGVWARKHPGQFNWMWYIIRQQETNPRIGGIRIP